MSADRDVLADARERLRRLYPLDAGGDAAETSADPWEPPIPLDEPHRPPFPLDALPGDVAAFVAAEATATQTPPDLPAVVALGAISAAVGGKVTVEVAPGYIEPVHVYALSLLASGNRKSSVFRDTTAAISAYERECAAADRRELARWQARRKIAEAQLAAEQKTAVNGDGPKSGGIKAADAALRAQALAEELAADRPPRVTQLIVDDVTAEKLGGLLADQRGALAVMSPEGGFFGNLGGRYSEIPSLDTLLKAHAGDTIRVNRIGRDAEYVPRPALTVCIAAQPSIAAELGKIAGFRGKGAAARFLPSLPESPLGRRAIDAPPVPTAVAHAWAALLGRLLALEPSNRADADGYRLPHTLTLSPAARDALRAFQAAVEPRLGERGDLATISDWAGKVPGAAVRLAALLHLATHAADPEPWARPISGATMAAAVRIADYFTAHALLFFDAMGDAGDLSTARTVRDALLAHDRDTITKRDLFATLRKQRRFRTVDDLSGPLRILEDHGFIRVESAPKTGADGRRVAGRPSVLIAINPLAQNPQNPQKPWQPPHFVPFGDFVQGIRDEDASVPEPMEPWEETL